MEHPEDSKLPKSPQRPKTADSMETRTSSTSSRSRMGTISSCILEDQISSPIDISTYGTSHAYSNSGAYRNDRRPSVSSVSTPSIRIDRQSPTPAPAISVHSASAYTASTRANTLPVPQPSSLPTSIGTHFPDHRRGSTESQDGQISPIKSVLSSNSSHLSGPVREAVTDPRMIVNLNEAGLVVSGTLEGFVQRLITRYSKAAPELCKISTEKALQPQETVQSSEMSYLQPFRISQLQKIYLECYHGASSRWSHNIPKTEWHCSTSMRFPRYRDMY